MSCIIRKLLGIPTKPETNRDVQLQKMALDLGSRGFALSMYCRENKGADQLRGYWAADLRLCFCIWKSRFSHDTAQIRIGGFAVECVYRMAFLEQTDPLGAV